MAEFTVNQVALDQFYHVQTNNLYNPFVTCFPTSVAMVIDYILTVEGKTVQEVGIDEPQIEDFITKTAKTQRIKTWLLNNISWGQGYLQKAWLVGSVEEKMFDDIMNSVGYDSHFDDSTSFEEVCTLLQSTNLPQVVCGDFSSANRQYGHTVGGHINCAIGFNDATREIIVHDPYGYALSAGYKGSGYCVKYPWNRFFAKNADKSGWCLQVRKS